MRAESETLDQPDHFPLQDQALPDLEHMIQVAARNAANRRKARNREQLFSRSAGTEPFHSDAGHHRSSPQVAGSTPGK